MDGTTEPVVAVVGHPIAGNPSQFALERALKALELEWRVLSFDVAPDRLTTALDGGDALGLRGLLIDTNIADLASDWYRQIDPDAEDIDCLYRDPDGRLTGCNAEGDWISHRIASHRQSLGRELQNCIWLGERNEKLDPRDEACSFSEFTTLPDPDLVAEADLIFIAAIEDDAADFEIEDWPQGDATTLIVDLTRGHPGLRRIAGLGFPIVSAEQRRIGMLAAAFKRWTGTEPPSDVIRDAIEEYLAV